MLTSLKRLWRGEIPLAQAFWGYAVIYGLTVDIACTALALLLYLAFDAPYAAAAVHFAPVPYGILAFTGVWRSANRYAGPMWHGTLAKGALFPLFIALLIF